MNAKTTIYSERGNHGVLGQLKVKRGNGDGEKSWITIWSVASGCMQRPTSAGDSTALEDTVLILLDQSGDHAASLAFPHEFASEFAESLSKAAEEARTLNGDDPSLQVVRT